MVSPLNSATFFEKNRHTKYMIISAVARPIPASFSRFLFLNHGSKNSSPISPSKSPGDLVTAASASKGSTVHHFSLTARHTIKHTSSAICPNSQETGDSSVKASPLNSAANFAKGRLPKYIMTSAAAMPTPACISFFFSLSPGSRNSSPMGPNNSAWGLVITARANTGSAAHHLSLMARYTVRHTSSASRLSACPHAALSAR